MIDEVRTQLVRIQLVNVDVSSTKRPRVVYIEWLNCSLLLDKTKEKWYQLLTGLLVLPCAQI
jgi:hypothetical protein